MILLYIVKSLYQPSKISQNCRKYYISSLNFKLMYEKVIIIIIIFILYIKSKKKCILYFLKDKTSI